MTHVLDSSAALAFLLGEPASIRVEHLVLDEHSEVALSVLTGAELWSRLRHVNEEASFESEWHRLIAVVQRVIPVTQEVMIESARLRRFATARLPTIDALIAATAATYGAVLVHRDPHFAAIPAEHLRQEVLP